MDRCIHRTRIVTAALFRVRKMEIAWELKGLCSTIKMTDHVCTQNKAKYGIIKHQCKINTQTYKNHHPVSLWWLCKNTQQNRRKMHLSGCSWLGLWSKREWEQRPCWKDCRLSLGLYLYIYNIYYIYSIYNYIYANKVTGQHGALGSADMATLFFLVLFSNSGVSQNYQIHEEPGFVVAYLYFVSFGWPRNMVCTFSSSCLDEVRKFPQSSPGIAGINLIETAYPGVLAPGHKPAHLRRRSLVETMSPLDWTVG